MTPAQKIQQSIKQWGNAPQFQWDICATWHIPNALREKHGGWDDRWHECKMRKYFNAVDRRIYKAAHKNRGQRVSRWMVMERAGGVGWHSHGLLQTPAHMTHEAFIDELCGLWHRHCGIKNASRFQSYLFEAELVKADFLGYTIKGLSKLNENANGVLDTHNSVLPKL
jgi:hypothetical protein